MRLNFKYLTAVFCLASPLLTAKNAQAEGRLVVYCTVQNSVCEEVTQRFGKKYNVETSFVHGSTGTILGKLTAEKNNPQADVWYGGTIEPHFQAADLGLLEPFRPAGQGKIRPEFKTLMDSPKGDYTSVIYMLVLGIGVNSEKLKKSGSAAPKSWEALLDPKFKGEIQLPDPRSSGTTFTLMATLISLYGEEKAFEYLKKLNENVSQYVKSNLVTANLARGESSVSLGFIHAYATEKEKGAPVDYVIPDGKTGYALGGSSIIKGARNLENAKLFADFVLEQEIQELPWRRFGYYQIPATVDAQASPQSPDPKKLDWITYDFEKFGNSEEGKRLLNRWLSEVKLIK